MAATKLQPTLIDQLISNEEAAPSSSTHVGRQRGGWITLPFVTVSLLGLTVAASGWGSNIIVFLIGQFNIKSIDAAQISNIISGTTSFLPILAAIIADSFFGSFSVVVVSSFISFVGGILLTLAVTVRSLRPSSQCVNEWSSSACETPSTVQFAVLYTALTLTTLGLGGTRFTIATMGADQFDKPKDQASFFNWYFVTLYVAAIIGVVGVVYIQDNVGWDWGFGICLAANAVGLIVFLVGKRYYRHVKPEGSPFKSLARVVVATIRKRKMSVLSSSLSETKTYYYGYSTGGATIQPCPSPTSSFRFLNRAALKTEGDTHEDGSIAKPWRLCTVQQVEDLKTLIRIFPLWSTSIFLSTPIGIQSSLAVLQALTMDRHIGPGRHFKVPAGSFLVFILTSTAITLTLLDRFLLPTYQKLTRRPLTPLQRVGIGHVLNIVGMAASALVEWRRLHVACSHQLTSSSPSSSSSNTSTIVPMSAFWLVIPLAIVGVGEAFHFPGQVALYYQEFPASLHSTSTAMISLLIAVGFYLSTAMIDLVQRVTGWLPNNINDGRLDNMFWLLVVIGVINFGYYLTCSVLYKYQNLDDHYQKSIKLDDDDDDADDQPRQEQN